MKEKVFNLGFLGILMLVIGMSFLMVGGVLLLQNDSRKELDNQNAKSIDISYHCWKEIMDLDISKTNSTYHRQDNYNFLYSVENQKVSSFSYDVVYSFMSFNDYHAVKEFPVIIKDTKFEVTEDEDRLIKTVTYFISLNYGIKKGKNFLNEYLGKIKEDGFYCVKNG